MRVSLSWETIMEIKKITIETSDEQAALYHAIKFIIEGQKHAVALGIIPEVMEVRPKLESNGTLVLPLDKNCEEDLELGFQNWLNENSSVYTSYSKNKIVKQLKNKIEVAPRIPQSIQFIKGLFDIFS
jgi:hypothetical protein